MKRLKSGGLVVVAAMLGCAACCVPVLAPLAGTVVAGGLSAFGKWEIALAALGATIFVLVMAIRTRRSTGCQASPGVTCTAGCSGIAPPKQQELPPPIACTLSAADFKERAEWLMALKQRALISHRIDGHVAYLTYDLKAEPDVDLMVQRERSCCSFLQFDLHRTSTVLQLTVTAPSESGLDAQRLFAHLIPER